MLALILSSYAIGTSLLKNTAGLRNQHEISAPVIKSPHHSFVHALEFKHRLRICNVYPYGAALDVYRAKEKLTDEPMKYKDCREFKIQLLAGDRLQFKAGDADVGAFAIASMPENDGVLLLVISRHDTLSTAVSFESHIFANLLNAQLAVIDTYKGDEKSTLRIQDHSKTHAARSEELRYDSVVAINPGKFDCVLYGKDGGEKKKAGLIALNREAYVVLRVGVDAQQGPPYAEEIIVYPQSDEYLLGGSSSMSSLFPVFLALLVL